MRLRNVPDLRTEDLQSAAVKRATETNGCRLRAIPTQFNYFPLECCCIDCRFEPGAAGGRVKDDLVAGGQRVRRRKTKPEGLSNSGASAIDIGDCHVRACAVLREMGDKQADDAGAAGDAGLLRGASGGED